MGSHNEKLENIYKTYGYKQIDSTNHYDIYIINYGRYNAVDIVIKSKSSMIDDVKSSYSALGYAVNIVDYEHLESIEDYLFTGSFQIQQTKERFINKYLEYVEHQKANLLGEYNYIDCDYVINDEINLDDCTLIDKVLEIVSSQGSQLILIEAAAGYGKTSTAFELFYKLLIKYNNKFPLYAEFSRDRQAKLIQHLLSKVIDTEFPTIPYDLVIHEIQNGRIPLIIDGFDELITKNNIKKDDTVSFLEPMLTTITKMLNNNAKIILTSRSTALFTSDDFASWLEDNSSNCNKTIIRIRKPEPVKWIGREKYTYLESLNYPIQHISNPVLLNFIKNISLSDLAIKCCGEFDLLDDYFERLLNREIDRQNLKMNSDEQKDLFINLAKHMLAFGISSDSKSFIKELLREYNIEKLNEVVNRYFGEESIELDELLEFLSNHALLDKQENNKIGFINDFIYGILCGEYTLNYDEEWINDCYNYDANIALVATAYKVRSNMKKELLYECLIENIKQSNCNIRLTAETDLINENKLDYFEEEIAFVDISKSVLGRTGIINSCIFKDSYFKNVDFHFSNISNILFLNCTFEKCTVHAYENEFNDIKCSGCNDYNSGFIDQIINPEIEEDAEAVEYDDYQVKVLQQFYPKGSTRARSKRRTTTLFHGFSADEKDKVKDAIDDLKKMELITVDGEKAELNLKNIKEIYRMIGRIA